ncbi:MAG: GNAT family N-acetyltransferase [Candidatus Thorarchaeota archaeon]|nr:GNAT family N-acetyltransferase [Candidatus Thorarchaeota archaeon]
MMKIAERNSTVLRLASNDDLPQIDKITAICYEAIHESWKALQGEDIYSILNDPKVTWQEKKNAQNHELFAEHPEWVWVLESTDGVIGYITFRIQSDKPLGIILNNGVLPEYACKGWGAFMYRHALQYLRDHNVQVAMVEVDLDDAHIPARRAYEAVGFDRVNKIALYWQNLGKKNPGSVPPKT